MVFLALLWRTGTPHASRRDGRASHVVLSVVGTNDLHGRIFTSHGRGGLALFGGFVRNLRDARRADGGAVLLVDAGDTFQGGIESNLSEGAVVVDAYNALGYTAAAIGNHEFDFGPLDDVNGHDGPAADPRGALKTIAARARFPVLAANLLDATTGRPVEWPNVTGSTLVRVADVTVGLIGVMTIDALRATLSVNVTGLRIAPLVETIAREARSLRSRGATVVVVVAHAGGRCADFTSPTDLSSCDRSSEIFEVARQLPTRLVDAIIAGHTHAGLAHEVAGIPIVEGGALGTAFSRVDLTVSRATKRVTHARPFPPREVCALQATPTGACVTDDVAGPLARVLYEGREVWPDQTITRAMEPALARVRARRAVPIGVVVTTPIRREGDLESPLGNLFAHAVRESTGADVALTSNRFAGLRADLEEGPLTFGQLYDVFPFDDRLVQLPVTGAELRHIVAADVRRERRGAIALSGVHARATCTSDGLRIDLTRSSSAPLLDADRLTLVTTDLLARGALFVALPGDARFDVPQSAPLAREVVAGWLRRRGGRLSASEFADAERPHWRPFEMGVGRCTPTAPADHPR